MKRDAVAAKATGPEGLPRMPGLVLGAGTFGMFLNEYAAIEPFCKAAVPPSCEDTSLRQWPGKTP